MIFAYSVLSILCMVAVFIILANFKYFLKREVSFNDKLIMAVILVVALLAFIYATGYSIIKIVGEITNVL